jgi:hypothetical protein
MSLQREAAHHIRGKNEISQCSPNHSYASVKRIPYSSISADLPITPHLPERRSARFALKGADSHRIRLGADAPAIAGASQEQS